VTASRDNWEMADDKQIEGVIGFRADEMDHQPLAGSQRRACVHCLIDAMFAPSGLRKIAAGAKPICIVCADRMRQAGELDDIQLPSKADLLEDLGFFGRN